MRTSKPQLSIVVQSPSDEAPQREGGRKAAAHKDTIIVFLSVMIFMVMTWWVAAAPAAVPPARCPRRPVGAAAPSNQRPAPAPLLPTAPARPPSNQRPAPAPLLPTAPARPPARHRRFVFVHRLYLNHLHDGDSDVRQNVIRLQKGGH
jgi:hypothetical protein